MTLHSGTHWKCTVILLILYQICFPRLISFVVATDQPLRLAGKFLLLSDLFDEKQKNLLNEDTSKEGSVADIDHILLGPQIHCGLSFASATRLLHSLYSILIPRTACCLSMSSLRGWTASKRYLSIHESGEKVRLSSDCLRHQPPIVQEHGDSRLWVNSESVHSRSKENFQLILYKTYWF